MHLPLETKFIEKSAVILSKNSQLPNPEYIFLAINICHLLWSSLVTLRPNKYASLHLPLTGDYSGLYSIYLIPSVPKPNPNPPQFFVHRMLVTSN